MQHGLWTIFLYFFYIYPKDFYWQHFWTILKIDCADKENSFATHWRARAF